MFYYLFILGIGQPDPASCPAERHAPATAPAHDRTAGCTHVQGRTEELKRGWAVIEKNDFVKSFTKSISLSFYLCISGASTTYRSIY